MPRGTSEVSEPMFFVLTALLNGPLHGHAISKLIQELSNGRVRPSVGTLYGILERLHERGVIAVDREETVNGRNRRYFRITDEGQALVEAEARRMQDAAALVLRLSPGQAQAWGLWGQASRAGKGPLGTGPGWRAPGGALVPGIARG
ncbi:PadR family transcriptional regulator [Nonomuraea endophytica]|uniref:DNA-binding PadR family transcriptional regulator n=1 Tax=Nonomuraea endophytica TaxID=714136 RepID=A0A7W8A928_9ACTN|nr:PadR family transcriptional regulator [Nonomuraea endophytica]MBB5080826.1 DNA-binding PadR family transcriptional regulator [Nonomuraea endophytica]